MRILYHHRTLGDGAEGIHIAEMVSAFRGLGHDVRVMGLAPNADVGERGVIGRVRRLLPAPAYELASVACNALEYEAVRKTVADFRPDLLYKRHARNDVAALALARKRGIKTVLEVNCLYSHPGYTQFEPLTFGWITARMERRALSLASLVLAVSSPLAQQVKELGIHTVEVVPNGANAVTFRPSRTDPGTNRARLGLPDALTIGWAGILRDWHGLDLLLDALTHLPGVTLIVVGDGPARPDVEARTRRLGLADRVVITGRLPHESMPEWLAAVDIAVVPDERTGVASPMKLLEYMAMGLTVVAPDLANIRDLVTPDVDGVLFRPGDATDLSRALVRLTKDPHVRQRLGANARLKIERERNWKRNAEEVIRMAADRGAGGRRHSNEWEVQAV